MRSNNILLADPTFETDTAVDCKLLVKIGVDNLSYAIVNSAEKKIAVLFDEQECEDGVLTLAARLKNDPYLGLNFNEIKVAFHSENSFAVPDELWTDAEMEIHSQFFTAPSNGKLYRQPHTFYGFSTLFSISPHADALFNREIVPFQQNAGLLKLAEKAAGEVLFLDFTVGTVNILYVQNQKVILQQGYEIEDAEEFNYYLLLLINQLGINGTLTTVQVSGIIHNGDANYICLAKYFNNTIFHSVSGLDLTVLEDLPAHYYSNLLALYECEL